MYKRQVMEIDHADKLPRDAFQYPVFLQKKILMQCAEINALINGKLAVRNNLINLSRKLAKGLGTYK